MNSRRLRRPEGGFTLIEIMIVMVIIAMLAALVGPRVMGALGSSKVKATKIQIETLSNAVEAFHLDTGRFPTQQEGLIVLVDNPAATPIKNWHGPYLKKNRIPPDEWGNPFVYEIPSKNKMPFDIYSLGADGKPGGTGDDADLGNWD
ncbi:MAG TPA: type II secretion system major pseudopilin GspG [Rhodocyclaceae bacterium]